MMRCRATGTLLALAAMVACSPAPPDETAEQSGAVNAESVVHGGDLTGVWEANPSESMLPYENFAFTAELPPMTRWAQARFAAAKPTKGSVDFSVADTNDPVYQCFPPGTPRVYIHPFPMEIVQTPGRVLMLFEYDHLIRQIYTDGRGHRTDLSPSWMGDSTGRWDGDTLVVETVNFNDKTWIDRRGVPHSEELRVVERIRRTDENGLQIDITIEDPVAFTEPWEAQWFYARVDWTLDEFICMDNVGFARFESELTELQIETPE